MKMYPRKGAGKLPYKKDEFPTDKADSYKKVKPDVMDSKGTVADVPLPDVYHMDNCQKEASRLKNK